MKQIARIKISHRIENLKAKLLNDTAYCFTRTTVKGTFRQHIRTTTTDSQYPSDHEKGVNLSTYKNEYGGR